MNWWFMYAGILVFTTGITALITPVFRALSWKLNLLDNPLGEHHKKHSKATPLLGGMAMLSGWLITVCLGIAVIQALYTTLPTELIAQTSGALKVLPLLFVVLSGAVALTIMGFLDDKRPMGPLIKFLLQFSICACVALYPKIRVTFFIQSDFITWLITVAWFLFIINAFNFFDNMDGLASGIAWISALIFTLVAGFRGQFLVAALGAATAGSAMGFYFYNRYPASIFMGDSGSHFLGYSLAILGTLTSFYETGVSPTPAPIFIPLLVLAVPIFDTFAVIVIRLKSGKPIYSGDHNHISHRFLRMGVHQKKAVVFVHLLSLSIGFGALSLLWLEKKGIVFVFAQAATILILISLLHRIESTKEQINEK